MSTSIRYTVSTLLFVCSLLLTSLPSQVQGAPLQAGTIVTNTGAMLDPEPSAAPTTPAVTAEKLAADQNFQNKLAFVNSLTEEQRAAFVTILDQHRPALDAIALAAQTALADTTANKVFLPLVSTQDGQTATAAQERTARTQKPDARINELMVAVGNIQNAINTEFSALLTAEQQVLFEQTGLTQAPQTLVASGTQNADDTQTSTDCYNGAVYGGVAFYWANYAEYYAYLDYIYVNNAYSYSDWYYNYYAKLYVESGLLYAGGAHARVMGGTDPGTWEESAYWEFNNALPNIDAGRYYAYWAWQYGSGYAYNAYIYADNAYYYTYWAREYIYYCSL